MLLIQFGYIVATAVSGCEDLDDNIFEKGFRILPDPRAEQREYLRRALGEGTYSELNKILTESRPRRYPYTTVVEFLEVMTHICEPVLEKRKKQ